MSVQAQALTRELIHGAFEQSPMGILVVDAKGLIIVANQELGRLLGYESDELLGEPIERLVPEPFAFRHRAARREFVLHPETREMEKGRELHARHKDGHLIAVEIGLSPMSLADEHFVLGTIVDVTERRYIQSQLIRARELESIANYSSGIAHDFNNILLEILGCADLAKQEDNLNPDLRALLEEIGEAVIRGRELSSRMLAHGRKHQSTRTALHWEPILRDALNSMRLTLPPRVAVNIQVDSGVPTVWAERIELHRIFANLLVNAAHAMAERGGIVQVQVADASNDINLLAVHPERASMGHVRLGVEDQGIGMSPDIAARAFEPYFTTKAPGEGTGMGLSIVRQIVDSLGGIILLDSHEGAGTRVDVYLPASRC